MDFWTALFLFLAGVLSHKLGSYLFFYTKQLLFFNDCAFASLRIFKFVGDAANQVNELKYADMKKRGVSEEEIYKEKDADEKMLMVWQEIAISGIKNLFPPKLRPMLRFNNWEEAMRLLTNRDKKE